MGRSVATGQCGARSVPRLADGQRRDLPARVDPADGSIPRRPARVPGNGARGLSPGVDLPHFVAVHDVESVQAGLYRWPDLSEPVRGGNLRAELRRVALGQGLAGDAAFVVISAADLTSISNRRYRDLQLAAGLVEGRLHLAAFALDYGASGMTFLDSEIPGLLQEDLEAMLFTCLGVPEYQNRPGGPPGDPVLVRQVVPRIDG